LLKDELRWYGQTLSKDLKQVRIVPIADAHYGNPLFSEKHFNRTTKFIYDNPDVYTVLVGDLCESVTVASKGDIYNQVVCPEMQRDNMIEFLTPIKHKILGMVTGNHEQRIKEIDISKDIAKALNVPYRPEGMLLKISFGSGNENHVDKPYTYWGYISHGYGGARTKSAKAVKVERVSTWIHADYYILSHDHVVNIAPDVYLMPDSRGIVDSKTGFTTGKVTAKRKMLIKTNAFLKWGGYSEMGGFPPTDLEPVIIILSGTGKPRVNVGV
jgi:hypothetical protein